MRRRFSWGLCLLLVACVDSESTTPRPAQQVEQTAPEPKPEPKSEPTVEPAPLMLDTLDEASRTKWETIVGATKGKGHASEVTWTAEGVKFVGEQRTRVWWALTREVEIGDTSWVELRVRMRTEGLSLGGGAFANCNAYVKHGAGLVATRVLMGTNEWTESRRRIELPVGTAAVSVGLFCSMPGSATFDQVSLHAADAPDWNDEVAGHYRYRTLGGETIDAEARAFNDQSYELVRRFLGVEETEPIEYRKYPDVETKEALSGRGGNAHREGKVIHTIWPTDRHEIVHVLADAVGDPPALLAEGLAVYLSGGWQGRPVREVAAEVVAGSDFVGLAPMLTSAGFRAVPDAVSYPVCGAFVEWLVETRGKPEVLGLYGGLSNQAPEAEIRAKFEGALGPLDKLEADFEAWLSST